MRMHLPGIAVVLSLKVLSGTIGSPQKQMNYSFPFRSMRWHLWASFSVKNHIRSSGPNRRFCVFDWAASKSQRKLSLKVDGAWWHQSRAATAVTPVPHTLKTAAVVGRKLRQLKLQSLRMWWGQLLFHTHFSFNICFSCLALALICLGINMEWVRCFLLAGKQKKTLTCTSLAPANSDK